jgi:hypothetical protein
MIYFITCPVCLFIFGEEKWRERKREKRERERVEIIKRESKERWRNKGDL